MIDEVSPYRIDGPANLSFSGGRTSAFMLHETVQAFGGSLPNDFHVIFANTGKEREETLDFVDACARAWRVPVIWIEWRPPPEHFEVVSYRTADRTGKWFSEVIRRKQYLPNATMRYCTSELKVKTMNRWMRAQGYENWNNVVGLRYDEGHRVMKQLARNDQKKERYTAMMPLASRLSKVTKADVMAFWNAQPFDLQLEPHEGNCDLCFLKSRDKLASIIKRRPHSAEWWIEQERSAKTSKQGDLARFNKYESFAQLADFVDRQGELLLPSPTDEEHDAECGLWCGDE